MGGLRDVGARVALQSTTNSVDPSEVLGSALPAQTGFAGAHYGLRAVGHLQLGEDAGDVVAHRLWAQV